MQTYVSFLRGINVGGRTIAMADLKDCYEQAGMEEVSTLLQSGNVVFKSGNLDMAAVRISLESAVSARFKYPAVILVRQQADLANLIARYPFDATDDHFQHYIIFLDATLVGPMVAAAGSLEPATEQVAEGSSVVYWKVMKGMTTSSPFAKLLVKAAYKQFHTVRNIKTVEKLAT
jgi:uncharacterized protein (DUF1697 family)